MALDTNVQLIIFKQAVDANIATQAREDIYLFASGFYPLIEVNSTTELFWYPACGNAASGTTHVKIQGTGFTEEIATLFENKLLEVQDKNWPGAWIEIQLPSGVSVTGFDT
jgi:hypothetical protein